MFVMLSCTAVLCVWLSDALGAVLLLLLLQHGKNINVDAWRLHQLAKATANPQHVWSHFFTGASITL
jgi:insulysin